MKKLIILSFLSCFSCFSFAGKNDSIEVLNHNIRAKIMKENQEMLVNSKKEETYFLSVKLMKNEQDFTNFGVIALNKNKSIVDISSPTKYVKKLERKENGVVITTDEKENKLYVELTPSRQKNNKLLLDVKIDGSIFFAMSSSKECSLDKLVCEEENYPTQYYFEIEKTLIFNKDSEVKTIELFKSKSKLGNSSKTNNKDTYKLVIEKIAE